MRVELHSPCKVNLILNILGRRPDGFHDLETVMHPVPICDSLSFERGGSGIQLSCGNPELPIDSSNLVYRAADRFLASSGIGSITEGVRIHLEKRIPMAAGLGGGSGNAAATLLGLNQLFDSPLQPVDLQKIAAELGSDIPFFLQPNPALATGRGEQVRPLGNFPALNGTFILLVHPGFGVSTPWAYKNLARFPAALNGDPGRAERLVRALGISISAALPDFYNSLEAPVLGKFPLLAMFQEFLRENGAEVSLMSGSGSTTFAIFESRDKAEAVLELFRKKFGQSNWTAIAPLGQAGA